MQPVGRRVDSDDGQIGGDILADHPAGPFAPVVQGYLQARRVGHDVVVGQDVSLFIQDDAGAAGFTRVGGEEQVVVHHDVRDVDHTAASLFVDPDIDRLVRIQGYGRGQAVAREDRGKGGQKGRSINDPKLKIHSDRADGSI